MLNCPHCREKAMSVWRKLFTSPLTYVACQNCGKPITVSWLSMVYALPFFALIVMQIIMMSNLWVTMMLVIALLCIYSLILIKRVPLV